MKIKNKKSKIKNSRGFSLLETLVALAVLITAVLGPLTLASISIRSASLSRNTVSASFLAEEAIEIMRARRDSNNYQGVNWLDKIESCNNNNPCIVDAFKSGGQVISKCTGGSCPPIKYDATEGLYQYVSGQDSAFVRTVWAEKVGTKEAKIKVRVEWQERFLPNPSTVDLEERIFDWR